MEMPEGYKKAWDQLHPTEKPFIFDAGLAIESMELMKEMAEALEDACEAYSADRAYFNQDPYIFLKKFKEWK